MSFSLWVVVDSCWATNPSDRPHISHDVARVLSVTGVPSPATGITSTFEELIYDEESSVYRATRATCSYAPYMPIVIVILIYVGLGLWAILDEEKIILFFRLHSLHSLHSFISTGRSSALHFIKNSSTANNSQASFRAGLTLRLTYKPDSQWFQLADKLAYE